MSSVRIRKIGISEHLECTHKSKHNYTYCSTMELHCVRVSYHTVVEKVCEWLVLKFLGRIGHSGVAEGMF